MENNKTAPVDLISTNETIVVNNVPLNIGILAISTLFLSIVATYTILPGFGIILFLGSVVLSIVGLVIASKYKKQYTSVATTEQIKKIQWGKGLSLTTLVLSALAIVAVISLIVMIGVNGFGR